MLILVHLAREGRQVIAANRMGDLLQAIDRLEPKNAALYYNTARPFARLAGRNQSYFLLTTYQIYFKNTYFFLVYYIRRLHLQIVQEISNLQIVIMSLSTPIFKKC